MMNAIKPASAWNAIQSTPSYRRIPRVLCATDLSSRSDAVVQRAMMLATQINALLLLLHVVDERQPPETIGLRAARARSTLEARQLTSSAEIDVRVGKPYQTIASVVNEWDADLVVLGAYRKQSGDQFFGTTGERVIRTANRAVLIVNSMPTGAYQDVLLTSDLSDASAQVVRMTQQLGLLDGVHASIVHVLGSATRSMLYSAGVTESQVGQFLQSMRQSARDDLIARLDAVGLNSARFTIIQRHGTPFGEIARVVEAAKPQLLVLGAARYPTLKRLLGTNVVNEVLRGIACDVLIVSPAAVRHLSDGESAAALPSHTGDATAAESSAHW